MKQLSVQAADSDTRELAKVMAKVEIYTSPLCGYCFAAKRLLNNKGVDFIEYDTLFKQDVKSEMIERADGKHTVPQIFIDSKSIGGFTDLQQLDQHKLLDSMLFANDD